MNSKKFNRQELERLGRNVEDIELILKCQKTLPVLFENNDIVKYRVNAIDLWSQIGSKNHFYDWSKNNIENSENIEKSEYFPFYCKVKDWTPNKRTKLIEYIRVDDANVLNRSLIRFSDMHTLHFWMSRIRTPHLGFSSFAHLLAI